MTAIDSVKFRLQRCLLIAVIVQTARVRDTQVSYSLHKPSPTLHFRIRHSMGPWSEIGLTKMCVNSRVYSGF